MVDQLGDAQVLQKGKQQEIAYKISLNPVVQLHLQMFGDRLRCPIPN